MKALMIGSLSAIVALAAAPGAAQDPVWRPASSAPAFQRVVSAPTTSITLSRPVPAAPAHNASAVVPVALLDRPAPTFRAKAIDSDEIPRLLPIGPATPSAKQPGVVKPMSQPEPIPAPRAQERFIADRKSVV